MNQKYSSRSVRCARILTFLLLSFLGAATMTAQAPRTMETGGTLFYIAYPDTTTNTHDHQYIKHRFTDQVQIFIYSAVQTRIEISGPGYPPRTKTIPGGRFTVVDLTQGPDRAPQPIVTEINRVNPAANNSFRIESEEPIIIYCYMVTEFGAEAWTPIPVDRWGQEYFAAAVPGEIVVDISPGSEFDYKSKNKMAPAEILIIAAYDNTEVVITPTCLLLHYPALVVTLNEGDVYQVQSWVDTLTANANTIQPDPAGTQILSSKPVGVISGNTRAQVLDDKDGLGRNIYKNMLIEWLPPVEQHGTEFVFMPTWDSRRIMGVPGERIEERRQAEFVRVYGTSPGVTAGYYTDATSSKTTPFTVRQGEVKEIRFSTPYARMVWTDKPAQVMMHSSAVVRYNGTTQSFGGYVGAQFDGWGAYMTELAPREHWTSFAPYYAPSVPQAMEHFINIVTDSASARKIYHDGVPFVLNRPIPGTDLVWGTAAAVPGRDHIIEGEGGAKFSAFVYGLYKGHEEYRPGRMRKDDGGPALAGAGDDDPQVLHPAEYEEYIAVAYGYPVASRRKLTHSGPGDSLEITTIMSCGKMTVTVRTLNSDPAGLRSVHLDSAVNTRISNITPTPVAGATSATIIVEPQNGARDASAAIVITDRTGKIWRVPYIYSSDDLRLTVPTELDFGAISADTPVDDIVTIRNSGSDRIIVSVRLLRGNVGFSISPGTNFPLGLRAGAALDLRVQANVSIADVTVTDTLVIQLDCGEVRVVLRATTAPCVSTTDLDFGIVRVGETQMREFRICNDGVGMVTFNDPLLTWLGIEFTVAQSQLDKLKSVQLGPGECVMISVGFTGQEIGTFRAVGKLWGNLGCRDTSVWRAVVDGVTGIDDAAGRLGGLKLDGNTPNPFSGRTRIGYTVPEGGGVSLEVFNAIGEKVATLVDERMEPGRHEAEWDGSGHAPGIYICRLSAGGRTVTMRMLLLPN